MPRVVSHSYASRLEFMGRVAQSYTQYFRGSGSRSECMQAIETALDVPRVKAARIRFWFGREKGFPRVQQLAAIVEHGAPVHVEGSTDIGAPLAYSNHRSVAPHSDIILAKIFDDVRFWAINYFSPQRSAHHPRFAAVSAGRGGVSVQNSDYPRFNVFVVSVCIASTLTRISRRPPS